MKTNRFYEETLPEGYREVLTLDAGEGKFGSRLAAAAMIVNAALFILIYFLYARPRMDAVAAAFSVWKCLGFIAAYPLYVVLHELVHGAAYKLLTGRKLTFGFRPPAAFCGVPDIYAYRVTAMCSLLSPLTVFSVLFAALFLLVPDPFAKALFLVLFSFHLSGCVGDLHGVGLYLFRFRDASTLRMDTGPKQIFYTKD